MIRIVAGTIACAVASPAAGLAEESVCARVKIEIEQRVVLTRTAFKATLKIENGLTNSIRDLCVALDIRDGEGNPANDRFDNLDKPEIEGISPAEVCGTGVIGVQGAATLRWLIFPNDLAAPGAETLPYDFGGQFSYTSGDTRVTIPMYPVRVEVMPDAKLFLEYFLQSPVYSDNPFSTLVEPAEPFSLGLLVKNAGYGPAKNMKIISSQPRIVENRDLLLIAFQIIGSQLWTYNPDGVPINPPVSPSLTIELGNVPPQSNVVARWLMTSTLQGKFIDYSATFKHTSPLANEITSLLRRADIYELNHMVKMDRPGDDSFPDFLVNNRTDRGGCAGDAPGSLPNDDLPDCVRASNGLIVPVRLITTGSTDRSPTVNDLNATLTVNAAQTGWTFIRVDDPSHGAFTLGQVLGPDGLKLQNDYNVWTTHRYLPIDGPPTSQEHRLYLFDYVDVVGPRLYTLMYEAGLNVIAVKVNDNLIQRSNITRAQVLFTQTTNLPTLIADGSITQAVTVWKRASGGDPASQIALTPNHFVWDAVFKALTVDLTIDGAGGSNQTILPDGNFELRLDTRRINNGYGTANLGDTDGTSDGVFVFGRRVEENFYRFAGDGNADRQVNEADELLVQDSWLKIMGQVGFDPMADMNSDFVVNLTDLQLVRSNWNNRLDFE